VLQRQVYGAIRDFTLCH